MNSILVFFIRKRKKMSKEHFSKLYCAYRSREGVDVNKDGYQHISLIDSQNQSIFFSRIFLFSRLQ